MRRILITGGSRGIGLALARRLIDQGDHVMIVSRSVSPAVDSLRATFPELCSHIMADLSQPDAVPHIVRAAALLDGIDGFVANAAMGFEGLLTLSAEQRIRECIEVNLVATVLLTKQVIKGMLTWGGSVVFVSSVAANMGITGLSVYSATKGGLCSFSRALAREYGDRQIRSNCVLPGFLETEMSSGLTEQQRDQLKRRTPLKRLGQADDAAATIAFLLSADAKHITGAELVVDGGLSG